MTTTPEQLTPQSDQDQQQDSDACRDCWEESAQYDGRCGDCHGEAVMRW